MSSAESMSSNSRKVRCNSMCIDARIRRTFLPLSDKADIGMKRRDGPQSAFRRPSKMVDAAILIVDANAARATNDRGALADRYRPNPDLQNPEKIHDLDMKDLTGPRFDDGRA